MTAVKLLSDSAYPSLLGADMAADDILLVQDISAAQIKKVTRAELFTAVPKLTIAGLANDNAIAVTGHSLTGSNAQSLLDLAGTWNTSGTPTAIRLNMTDTASGAGALLLDFRTGGVSRFSVSKIGDLAGRSLNLSTFLTLGANNSVGWSGRAAIYSPANAVFLLSNTAGLAGASVDVSTADTIKFGNFARNAAAMMQFGVHAAIGAETVTGYITIKDYAGNDRKIAVVS